MAAKRGGKRGRDARGAVERPVFLLTDFGLQDTYVGVLKTVLRALAPQVTIDDLTHAVPPQDLAAGAWQLFTALPWLPAGSLTVVVVDPGVGSTRGFRLHRWAAATGGDAAARWVLSPDNDLVRTAFHWLGALGPAPTPAVTALCLGEDEVAALLPAAFAVRPTWGRTFDGRDRLAPLAARLATRPFMRALPAAWRRRLTPEPPPTAALTPVRRGAALVGRLLQFDRFGNGITNFSLHRWPGTRPLWIAGRPAWRVFWQARELPLVASYSAAAGSRPVALVGSGGLLELAINGGSFLQFAGGRLRRKHGLAVELRPRD